MMRNMSSAYADVEVPCSENPPPLNQVIPDEPSLIADPTCGDISEQDGTPGTLLHLQGYNFVPGMKQKSCGRMRLGMNSASARAGNM